MTGPKDPQSSTDRSERTGSRAPGAAEAGRPAILGLAQVNLVVADLERSRDFYTELGFSFREITLPSGELGAWASTDGPVSLGLHTSGFARWWDPDSPGVKPGATVVDLNVSSAGKLDELVRALRTAGAAIPKDPQDMPWGQRYAIIADPDGYRWGLKSQAAVGGTT